MSKLAHSNQKTMDEIEAAALANPIDEPPTLTRLQEIRAELRALYAKSLHAAGPNSLKEIEKRISYLEGEAACLAS